MRLFIPLGDLTLGQFAKIADVTESGDAEFLRFSQEQDLFIGPFMEEGKIKFQNLFPEFAGDKLHGLIKSCVGASVCKIGLLDTQPHARLVSEKLTEFLFSFPVEKRKDALEQRASMVKISRCHNSCGLNRAVKFGFQGMKENADGKMRDYYKFQKDGARERGVLSEDAGLEIPADELPDSVLKFIKEEVKF